MKQPEPIANDMPMALYTGGRSLVLGGAVEVEFALA